MRSGTPYWGLAGAFAFLGWTMLPVGQAKPRPAAKPKPAVATPSYAKAVAQPLNQFCLPCHSGKEPAAGVSLDRINRPDSFARNRDTWERVVRNVQNKHMPPPGMPKPSDAQRQAMVAFIERSIAQDCNLADAGRVTLRRLNRTEYDNTVRDLLGVDLNLAADFPSDDVGYGFDNIGDVLSTSPLLMEKLLDAAERASLAAVRIPRQRVYRWAGADLKINGGAGTDGPVVTMYSNAVARAEMEAPFSGRYRMRVVAYAQQAGPEPARMVMEANGERQSMEVKADRAKPAAYEFPLTLEKGQPVRLSASFVNDWYEKDVGDRNLYVEAVELEGPLGVDQHVPASHRLIIPAGTDPKDRPSVRRALDRLASRAYRRPARIEEVDRLVSLVDLATKAGEPFERGMQLAVQAVLSSPNFLFRVEPDGAKGKVKERALNDFELASRLSYFLWASMPDDRLYDLARQKKLSQPAVLVQETRRMLQDPKSLALADSFAMQWLQLRKLDHFQPDPEKYSSFNSDLKQDMVEETRRFFDFVVRNNRPATDFLNARYSFVNERLARHYGIKGISGNEFRRIVLTDPNRAGVLTQASVLTATSNPTRTSPTKRGKWVLENILGTPPPPPPPGVGDIKDERKRIEATTLRKLMEEHRKNPTCFSCHARMDPIGFGMENFDTVGRWRTSEGKAKIDASGVLPDGRKFDGPVALRAVLMQEERQFLRTLSDRLLTYALGRGVRAADQCAIDDALARASKNENRIGSIIEAIVLSEPFRKQGSPQP